MSAFEKWYDHEKLFNKPACRYAWNAALDQLGRVTDEWRELYGEGSGPAFADALQAHINELRETDK